MRRFDLVEPTTLEEACGLIANNDDAKAIAGGTALLTLIKHGIFVPKTLVNLKKIQAASDISYGAQTGLRIGALTTIYDIEASPLVRQHYAVLAEACHVVANIRIRNMATIGGNLAHGDYQSDPPTVLVALEAVVELLSRTGMRRMKLSDFLKGSYETAIEPGELVSALILPPADHLRGTYTKFTAGSSEERPCVGIAALASMDEGVCVELRLAVGAVSPKPVRLQSGESMARGERLTQELIERIAQNAGRNVDPIDDLRGTADYKRHLVHVLTRRALSALAGV
ncbi:MAG: subunit alpha of 6-hydroxypseudooxynicotine dehydrogenase complex [Deltaproteobacteria bacterium]|jgi:carbon-monoxide dehydrogenase medium subunit|nr:subunit alpha of 6-hydroxypseudooxynicotine dehydrogenase complex [Deltaproteobacteria bacterium]